MTPLLTFTMATPTPAPAAPGAGLFTSPFLLSLLSWDIDTRAANA